MTFETHKDMYRCADENGETIGWLCRSGNRPWHFEHSHLRHCRILRHHQVVELADMLGKLNG